MFNNKNKTGEAMKVKILLLSVFSLYLLGCTAGRSSTNGSMDTSKSIPPGQCRIIATVIKIDSTLSGGTEKDPCSKVPCTAWIRVKSIVAYGAGSGGLNRGDTLKTKFAFTLEPTNSNTFPNLKENLPGLNEGASFIADIQLIPSNPVNPKKEKVYLVYGYKKIE